MTHPTKRDVTEALTKVKHHTDDRELVQQIPYDSLEEWAEVSGQDVNWIYELEGIQ